MTRIGYAKVGRALHFGAGSWGMQGDPAAPQLIRRLAERHPDVTFVALSKNDNEFAGYPTNIENAWPPGSPRASWNYIKPGIPLQPIEEGLAYERDVIVPLISDLDGVILDWGQHGTSHMFIPQVPASWAEAERSYDAVGREHGPRCPCKYTHPHAWARSYGAAILQGVNAFQDRQDGQGKVVHIVEDSRNFIKGRDLKWPTGTEDVLCQHNWTKTQIHERFMDLRTPGSLGFDGVTVERHGELWKVQHKYRHASLEFMILPDDWKTWDTRSFAERTDAGIATTAYWTEDPCERRSWLTKEYLLKAFPGAKIYGKWDKKSTEEWNAEVIENQVDEFADLLASWRVTLILPPAARTKEGAFWTTAKPWQAFAAGVVAFFIPPNDMQGWILPNRRPFRGSREVARGFYSIRDDWTEMDLWLAQWLRCENSSEFETRAKAVIADPQTWQALHDAQLDLLERRWNEKLLERTIESKLGLPII